MVRVLPLMGAVAALALCSQLLSVVLYDAPQPTPSLHRATKMTTTTSNNVRTLLRHGPSHAAVDVAFFSEAYLPSQREKFFADARVVIDEHFAPANSPFHGVLPLFNFHAVFVPSNASRIDDGADDGGPASPPSNKTAFRAYRERGLLRGILPAPQTIPLVLDACAAALGCAACDFPVLLVNDAHYGGLSDRVTIITNSRTSGTISARHELAHSFGDFGEEYDGALGGEDYSGANFAATTRRCREGEGPQRQRNGRLVWQCLNWERWLTPPPGEGRDAWLASTAASSVLLYAEYPWTVLGARAAPWEASFDPPAAGWHGTRLQLSWSVAGVVGSGAAFEIELDGQRVEWTPEAHDDRQFHSATIDDRSSGAPITLRVRPALSAEAARDAAVPPTFCHVMVHAIAADAPSIAAEAVGAFPLYGPGRRVVGYRPTQDACLMRDMRRRQLCPICREALWENLLLSKGARAARISLLHSIRLRSASVDGGGDELVEIEVATAPLGTLRPPEDDAALALAEILELTVAPRRGGGELALRPSARRTFVGSVRLARLLAFRCWRVEATLQTPHVRSFGVRSELCFCVADRGGLSESLSRAPLSGRLGVRCVPCDGKEVAWTCPAGGDVESPPADCAVDIRVDDESGVM